MIDTYSCMEKQNGKTNKTECSFIFFEKFDMGIIKHKFNAEFESVEKSAKMSTQKKL
jgi:hypothetical protein